MSTGFSEDYDHRRSNGVWNVLNRFLIAAIILVICAAGALAFIPIMKQRGLQTSQIERLQADLAKQKAILARRTREADLLKSDPEYIETIARDRLDMMKPGETIIRLEPARSPAAPRSSSKN